MGLKDVAFGAVEICSVEKILTNNTLEASGSGFEADIHCDGTRPSESYG
jgi:hypothetical protein